METLYRIEYYDALKIVAKSVAGYFTLFGDTAKLSFTNPDQFEELKEVFLEPSHVTLNKQLVFGNFKYVKMAETNTHLIIWIEHDI